jgi:hypothetical protein
MRYVAAPSHVTPSYSSKHCFILYTSCMHMILLCAITYYLWCGCRSDLVGSVCRSSLPLNYSRAILTWLSLLLLVGLSVSLRLVSLLLLHSRCEQVVKADNEGMNQVMTGMESQLKAYAAKEEATNQLVKESILKVCSTVLLHFNQKPVV